MNVIPNTNSELKLAVPVHEIDADGSKHVTVEMMPVVAWTIESVNENLPLRITPLSVGSDNDNDGAKIVYDVGTEKWHTLNHDHSGDGLDDLIKLFNLKQPENDNE